jgi:CIC family chloride channel protein
MSETDQRTPAGGETPPAGGGEAVGPPPGFVARLAAAARKLYRRLDFVLARRFALATREERLFFLLIPTIGLVAGLLGILVHRTIDGVRILLWGYWPSFENAATMAPAWQVVLAPTVGGLLVGLVIWWAKDAVGARGMSSLIEAVALHRGHVPLKPVFASAAAAIATVGSGGSLGREGPLIRLGAAISSWLGERFGLSAYRVKILVGCGAAAGFAASYNVPIGGSLFAMEVILGSFALEIFGPIVIAAVVSTLIARAAESNTPLYAFPGYTLDSSWEILAFVGLGLVGAVASLAFVLGVRWTSRLFGRFTALPAPLRPALGMFLLGLFALAVPQVLGSGFVTIHDALAGSLPWSVLLLLPVWKLVATALTLGSGGSGGLFTPSLFFGALVGGAYGLAISTIFPGIAHPGAFAAVGMAAIAAGTSHAPLSAILMLFEFTGNYELILPLMAASIVSSWTAKRLYPFSIYTEPLQRRGVELSFRMEEAALAGLAVRDLARDDRETLAPETPYSEIIERFFGTRRQRLFVVDAEKRLLGSVSLHDIKHALRDPDHLSMVNAHDLMAGVPTTLAASERLHRAAETLAKSDFERLPVLDDDGRFVGVLAKRDLLAVYAQEVLGRPAVLSTYVASDQPGSRGQAVELPPDFALRAVAVPHELAGRTLAECALPATLGVRVLEIKRPRPDGVDWIVPGAATVLEPGDDLVILGPTRAVEALAAGRFDDARAAADFGTRPGAAAGGVDD